MSYAVSNLVGNSIGSGNAKHAKIYAYVTWVASLALGIIFMIIVIVFKKQISDVFTSHKNISEIVIDSLPLVAVENVFQFLEGTGEGTIKAMGYQKLACIIVSI